MLKEPFRNKLSDQYAGPYKISKILDNNNVQIEINSNKKRIVHTDKLKIVKDIVPLIRLPPFQDHSEAVTG